MNTIYPRKSSKNTIYHNLCYIYKFRTKRKKTKKNFFMPLLNNTNRSLLSMKIKSTKDILSHIFLCFLIWKITTFRTNTIYCYLNFISKKFLPFLKGAKKSIY